MNAFLSPVQPSSSGLRGRDAGARASNDNERLRLAAEACADILILVDRNLHVVFTNRGSDKRAPHELRGMHIAELIPQEHRERALQCMRGVLQVGVTDRFEFQMLGPRGTPRHIEMRVAPVREQDQIVALTLNGSDTTQHVLAQRAVATQAKMIESMLEGVALINEVGLIAITNPAFDALFGYDRGMLIGRSLASLTDVVDELGWPRNASGAGPWPLEFEAHRPDGTGVSVAGALSRLDDTERRHGLLVLQDVGARKNLERAILEAVNREQDRIGNDLHDGLGQELTGIALMLRCLAGRLQAAHGEAPPEIEGITRLLNNAVENTRSLARGLSPVHLERRGLRDALEGLAMHARNVYGIKAEFIDKFPPTIRLPTEVANHLYRIAQEAVTNAVKHGKAGSVRVHLTDARIAGRGKVRLTIADDGVGMPPEILRAASGDLGAPHVSGEGMGLRIMRYRARIAHGDVRFENGVNSGTRVICECPVEPDGSGASAETPAPANDRAQPLTSQPRRARANRKSGQSARSHGTVSESQTPASKMRTTKMRNKGAR